jgi:hypothetical protein
MDEKGRQGRILQFKERELVKLLDLDLRKASTQ